MGATRARIYRRGPRNGQVPDRRHPGGRFLVWGFARCTGVEIVWHRRVRVGRRWVCHGTGSGRHCRRTAGRVARRIYDHDVAFNANVRWSLGPWYPDTNHYDLESVVLHELGHFAGNPHHQPRCTNSPMVEALGAGEFWRAPGEWFGTAAGSRPTAFGPATFADRRR